MDKRKELILYTIIKEHIKTGAPVGSDVLVRKYRFNISPATVRNEMAELEDEGHISQPHTSAGRVPTEQAYNLYINNLNDQATSREGKKLSDKEVKLLNKLLSKKDEQHLKQTAKAIAKFSNNAVFWAFHRNNLYYTGIYNLLQQPEFFQTDLIYDISAIIDRVDEIIDDIFDEIKSGPQILLGADNPFGDFCSTVLAKYKRDENTGLFGIIGPMRMNYEKNLALINFVNDKISNK